MKQIRKWLRLYTQKEVTDLMEREATAVMIGVVKYVDETSKNIKDGDSAPSNKQIGENLERCINSELDKAGLSDYEVSFEKKDNN